MLVPKPDGPSGFVCIDFRQLNAIATFDAYPMSQVDALLGQVGQVCFLSMLDLTKDHW